MKNIHYHLTDVLRHEFPYGDYKALVATGEISVLNKVYDFVDEKAQEMLINAFERGIAAAMLSAMAENVLNQRIPQ